MTRSFLLTCLLLAPVSPFVIEPCRNIINNRVDVRRHSNSRLFASSQNQKDEQQQQTVQIRPDTDDAKVTELFAWVSRAYAGDAQYDNLMLAIATVYGDLPKDSPPVKMLRNAMKKLPKSEDEPCGSPVSLVDRERASLGAMGAAQWTGQFRTRPHALLDLHNITTVQQWESGLPRGCRRTLKRADAQNFTVTARPIENNKAAPHSSLAHFRCVMEHEIRLLAYSDYDFFDALAEAVSRFFGTTRMAGEIREYRDEHNKIIAFAHEIRKGATIRGQWFYATNEASKRFVWFDSVKSLVERAIEAEGVNVVDLGPSGSDGFSELKSRYGFVSVDDWPKVADYRGPFWDYVKGEPTKNGLTI